MKSLLMCMIVLAVTFTVVPTYGDSTAAEFGRCMTDSLNGKERKMLAKWIFFAIAAHPDIRVYSKISGNDVKESDQYVGKLITRLLTENCPNELIKARNADPQALEKAFALVGQVAMQELMSNQDVMKSITGYTQYTDQDKIRAVMSQDK